jgi:hypothetical protein
VVALYAAWTSLLTRVAEQLRDDIRQAVLDL